MRLYNIYGKLSNKSVGKYRIDWDGKSRSKAQFKVKQFLKEYWSTHVVFEEFPVYGSKMHVDILNATTKVAVEVNGAQHNKFVPFFHKNSRSNYLRSIKRDHKKYNWLKKNEFQIVEILDTEANSLCKDFFEDKFGIIL